MDTTTPAANTFDPRKAYGKPIFSLPDRPIKTKDGKSEGIVRVQIPVTVLGGLQIETMIWRTYVDTGEQREERLSVSLPRGMRAKDGDANGQLAINAAKDYIMAEYDTWELTFKGNPAIASPQRAGVRTRLVPKSPTPTK